MARSLSFGPLKILRKKRRAGLLFQTPRIRLVDVLLMAPFQGGPLHAARGSVDMGFQDELFGDRLLAIETETHDDDGLKRLALEPGRVLAFL